jgi:hypothetical protein
MTEKLIQAARDVCDMVEAHAGHPMSRDARTAALRAALTEAQPDRAPVAMDYPTLNAFYDAERAWEKAARSF